MGGSEHARNWFLFFIPDELHQRYKENTEEYCRYIIGTTSAFVLLVTLLVGYYVDYRSAPHFVRT